MDNKEKQKILKQRINDFKPILSKCIEECNQVFLISHNNIDFDAIASLGAMALICKKHKISPYIIINDNSKELSDEAMYMIDKIKEKFIVLNKKDYDNKKTDNDLLIVLDTNKTHMTSLEDEYKNFKDIIILDHHLQDDKTISTRNKLIIENVSSCSEILYYLLKQYSIVSSDLCYYTFLLAGIYLDTNKCEKNMQLSTYDAIKGLIEKGADQVFVDRLFSLDFESDRKVHRLVDNTSFTNIRAAISVSASEIYTKQEVAKAADYMLRYNCDLAIASGKDKDGNFIVSARTKNASIGIDKIMHILNNGGGNLSSASCDPIYVDSNKSDLEKADKIRSDIIKILTFKY